MRVVWPVLAMTFGIAGAVHAQIMPTRTEGIVNALCIQTADKSCPGGTAPSGAVVRQIVVDYRSEREGQYLDSHYAQSLAGALNSKALDGQCFEIVVDGARETSREYALGLTYLHAVRIESILIQNNVPKDRLVSIGLGKEADPRGLSAQTPFRAILKSRLGPC